MNKVLDELLRQSYLVSEENEKDTEYKKLYVKVESALKLNELVDDRIQERTQDNSLFISTDFYQNLADDLILKVFQLLVEESKQ